MNATARKDYIRNWGLYSSPQLQRSKKQLVEEYLKATVWVINLSTISEESGNLQRNECKKYLYHWVQNMEAQRNSVLPGRHVASPEGVFRPSRKISYWNNLLVKWLNPPNQSFRGRAWYIKLASIVYGLSFNFCM